MSTLAYALESYEVRLLDRWDTVTRYESVRTYLPVTQLSPFRGRVVHRFQTLFGGIFLIR